MASYVGEFAEMGLCRILPTTLEIGVTYHMIKEQTDPVYVLFAFVIAENTRLISVFTSSLRNANRKAKYRMEVLRQKMEESYKKFENTNQELSDIIELEEWDEDDDCDEEGEGWKRKGKK